MNFTPPSILIVLLLASTSAVLITYLATHFMSRQSSALRHFLWLLSLAAPLVALALFPLGGFLTLPILPPATSAILQMPPMPHVEPVPASPEVTTVMIRPNVSETKQDKVAGGSHPAALTVPAIFAQVNGWILIWFLGVLISILKRGVDLLRINNFVKTCCLPAPPQIIALADEIAGHMLLSCRPRLLIARANQIPFCHGLFSPVVVIPEGESITKYTVYLQHEFAHLVRRDLAALSLAQMTSTLCWFNPLVWLAVKMLRQESERAADDLVLSNGEGPEVYATHLVELIETCQSEPTFQTLVLAMARPGMVQQRIQSILDGTVIRTPPSRWVLVSLGCAFFSLIFSSVCLRLAEAEDGGTNPNTNIMRVHVVDFQDQPIAGAQVTPVYLHAVGYSCRWYLPGKTQSEMSKLKFLTDEKGTASVPYPLGSDSNDKVTEITVKVEHPNYAIAGEIKLDPVHPSDITLFPGETLKVQTLSPKGEVLSHPFLLTDSRSGSWHYSDDGTTLISNVALPLNKNLEVMGIVEDRPNHLLFSDIKTVVCYKPGGNRLLHWK